MYKFITHYGSVLLKSRWINELIDFFLIFGGVFFVGMIVLNFQEVQYEWNDYIHADTVAQEKVAINNIIASVKNNAWVSDLEGIKKTAVQKVFEFHEYNLDEYLKNRVDTYDLAINMLPPDHRLIVASLGINTPIVDVKYASEKKLKNSDFKDELEKGVVKYPFTLEPGNKQKGSSLFFGHSSVDIRDRNNPYGYVFRKLAKIADGEKIEVIRKGKMHTYIVDKKEVVSPTEVGKTLSGYDDAIYATLMSCYPLYTSKNRMLVRARLVDNKSGQLAMR